MNIAILHLSDFHIKDTDRIKGEKIDRIVDSLNTIGDFDECIIIFSGDLANTGEKNEYKKASGIFGRLIAGIKK